MKDFFYNSQGHNTAIVECETSTGPLQLHYHLYDHPVQHIWQSIHQNDQGRVGKTNLPQTVEQIKDQLNYYCQLEGLPNLPCDLDRAYLNHLHHLYVLSDHNANWLVINDLIHALENKIDNNLSAFDSTVTFYAEQDAFIPLREEYKIFLNTDITWGRLVLGFGTLGKDWIDIAKSNDGIEDLAIQNTISSETRLTFCVEPPFPGLDEKRLYNWATNSTLAVPLNKLNELSMGRYHLGQLIITDAQLAYHPIANDWYVPNHRCKLLWGKQVLNSIIKVNSIKFASTDLLYESLIAHSQVGDILNG